jgi:putative prepilin-type N-cleavage/methylation domain protein
MRRGFSLIELILSIVVVGISVIAIPKVLSQTTSNNQRGLMQQSVMDTKTRMALVLKSPYACVGNLLSISSDKTPIFGNTVGIPGNNFYTVNGIVADVGTRRQFGNYKTNAAMDPQPCIDPNDISVNSFNTNVDGVEPITIQTSQLYGSRDNIISSTINTATQQRNMQGAAANDITEIIMTTTTTMGSDTQNIILRAYAANIGDSPNILSRSW